jgi:DNA-binding MarR family transcriptional regulator
MTSPDPLTRIAGALGAVLLRSNRAALYSRLTAATPDLDETLYPVLSGLARLGTATATVLAEQIGLDRSVTTRYVARLEQAGLIARAPHAVDRRAMELTLTPTGRAAIAQSRKALRQLLAQATESWSQDQLHDFAASFEQLISDVERVNTRSPATSVTTDTAAG